MRRNRNQTGAAHASRAEAGKDRAQLGVVGANGTALKTRRASQRHAAGSKVHNLAALAKSVYSARFTRVAPVGRES